MQITVHSRRSLPSSLNLAYVTFIYKLQLFVNAHETVVSKYLNKAKQNMERNLPSKEETDPEGCHGYVSNDKMNSDGEGKLQGCSTEVANERLKKERDEFGTMASNVLNEINERMRVISHLLALLDEIKSDLVKMQDDVTTRKVQKSSAKDNHTENDVSIHVICANHV